MNRRKKKLIKSGLQLKLVSAFLAMAVVAALFQVALLNYSLLELTEDTGVQAAEIMTRLSTLVVRNLLITFAVLIPFMLVFGVLITHRIAGPVYKFERFLEGVARGEETGECRIRKGDELQELCERINLAVQSLRQGQPAPETPQTAEPPRAA